jgi:hypothetical protein
LLREITWDFKVQSWRRNWLDIFQIYHWSFELVTRFGLACEISEDICVERKKWCKGASAEN